MSARPGAPAEADAPWNTTSQTKLDFGRILFQSLEHSAVTSSSSVWRSASLSGSHNCVSRTVPSCTSASRERVPENRDVDAVVASLHGGVHGQDTACVSIRPRFYPRSNAALIACALARPSPVLARISDRSNSAKPPSTVSKQNAQIAWDHDCTGTVV